MKVMQGKLIDVMGQPGVRFAVPVFQRVYSWNARQCEELWEDVMRAGRAEGADVARHFMGVLLLSSDPEQAGSAVTLNLIDGQQRMTTMSLLLVALRSFLEQTGAYEGDRSLPAPDEIMERYLAVQDGVAAACKLVLSAADRATLDALACGGEQPEQTAQRLVDNCLLFSRKMEAEGFDASCFWRGVNALEVACAHLGPEDSPQLVFESLNAKGMPLSTADRVRNLVVVSGAGMGEAGEGEELQREWLALEDAVAEAGEGFTLTGMIEAWLARDFRSTRIFDPSDVYGVFKDSLRDVHGGSLERMLRDISDYGELYLSDPELRERDDERARSWTSGKPEKSVSEFKMFGD